MNKKPTLHMVAKLAKVSPATVTRVAAGNRAVDAAIRDQVYRAAAKLGMNLDERRHSKSRILGFLLANRDVLHSFQARVLLGAERYCAQHQWELLFMSFQYSPTMSAESLHLPQILSDRTNARAVILGGTNSANLFQALSTRGIPFAVLGNNVVGDWKPADYDVVYSDDVAGARDATRHLIANGHRRIAFIGNLQLPWFAHCARGYGEAMTGAGLEPRCIDVRTDGTELGFLGAKMLIENRGGVTAILAGTDQVAAGIYSALREAAVSVPEEMSVVGFNDTQAALFYPPLTSVREFPEELGRHLAELVLNRLRSPRMAPQQVTIPTGLEVRQSVAKLSESNPALKRRAV
jgi:DNA-binding LacI/PurR family transcriptional regulator